jgi:hypothetical protein
MGERGQALTQAGLQALARRPDIGGSVEIPHHRGQSVVHVLRNAVEQKIFRAERRSTTLPAQQQRAVEQAGGRRRSLGHVRWLSLS